MLLLELLAEKKIQEAAARGELDDLPGQGAPLALDDDALVPEDMRVANRILKNAGFERAEPVKRLALLERAKLESRYFGKVLKKLSR